MAPGTLHAYSASPDGNFITPAAGSGETPNLFVENHPGRLSGAGWEPRAASKSGREPLAVCGLAVRLPGGIRNAEDFWDVLVNGKDTKTPIPSDRYNPDGFQDVSGLTSGYFLDNDLSKLDTTFFNWRKSELEVADPQQRQILEVTRECLENAGEVDYRGKTFGCYVGTFGDDWMQLLAKDSQVMGASAICGYSDLMLANRVSYEYDFKGPSMVIKTGCSASLVSLHEACRALQSGDCEGAIVAGTNLIMSPVTTAALASEGVLSPEASCKTFDATADGYARGEAVNAVFIKRLSDALRQGSPIRAVIRSTGTNGDGRSQSLTMPNGEAHDMLIRKVYLDCGLDPMETAFVECHGTGTPTGDPIEATAIGSVFGKRGVLIGSVKPNVGHSEGASGLTGLIKAILALEHKIIPPNIKFTTPNPKIPFDECGLVVPTRPIPLPLDRAERISISSYGIGGSNAHVILDSLEEMRPDLVEAHSPRITPATTILVFSANSEESLRRQVDAYRPYIDKYPNRTVDLSYTLAARRENLTYRTYSLLQEGLHITPTPFRKISNEPLTTVWAFGGQGAQWPRMGKDMYEWNARFRKDIDSMDDILRSLRHSPDWTIRGELSKPATTSKIDTAELSQTLCTAVQIALVNIYSRCGIQPSAVVGHSSGEIAASYACGVLSMREAIIVAYYRGYVTRKISQDRGGMAAIGLSPDEVSSFLVGGVVVACVNSPTSVTISGDRDKLTSVMQALQTHRPDAFCRRLKVNMAYHSQHMEAVAADYLKLMQAEMGTKRTAMNLRIPMFSSVTDDTIACSTALGPSYWCSNLLSPVLFCSSVTKLVDQNPNIILLEISPHSVLAGPLRQTFAASGLSLPYVPTMLRDNPSVDTLLSALGHLFQYGIDVDFTKVLSHGKTLSDLPIYPWDHGPSYWFESRVSRDWRIRSAGRHPLLGERVPEASAAEPCWRSILKLENLPWLRDHRVRNDVVFPMAAYIHMALEAMRQISGIEDAFSLKNVVVSTALLLADSMSTEVVTTFHPHRLNDRSNSSWYDFSISSYTGTAWIQHCHGRIKTARESLADTNPSRIPPQRVSTKKWYNFCKKLGLVYGPAFQCLAMIASSNLDRVASAQVNLPRDTDASSNFLHACSLDSAFQLLLVALSKGTTSSIDLCTPTRIQDLYIAPHRGSIEATSWILEDVHDNGLDGVAEDHVVLRLRGMHFGVVPKDDDEAETGRHAAARLQWEPDFDFIDPQTLFQPVPGTANDGRLVEELTLLCLIHSKEEVEELYTDIPHFIKFRNWLQDQVRSAELATYPFVDDSPSFVRFSKEQRLEQINVRFEALKATSKSLMATGLKRLAENIRDIFVAEADPLEILMQDGVLADMYNTTSIGFGPFVHALCNKKPNLRILEIGAGTGGATGTILRHLIPSGPKGNPPYSIYTFSDISAGFFAQAKERFSYAPNMEFQTLDISRDPLEQGFEAYSFDLIIGSNCVHATPHLQNTLRNLHLLLHPNGRLVLSELCTQSKAPGYCFGVFSGWWLGEADDRAEQPFVSTERWDAEFREAGFTGVDSIAHDNEGPYQYCAAILTRPRLASANPVQSVTVLCNHPKEGVSQRLIDGMRTSGMDVAVAEFGEKIPTVERIISTLDLEHPLLDDFTEEKLFNMQEIMRHAMCKTFLWLMPPTQTQRSTPNTAKSLGVLRSLRTELGVPFTTLEIREEEVDFIGLVAKVFHKVSVDTQESLLPDVEYTVEDGIIQVGRYHPFLVEKDARDKMMTSTYHEAKLEIEKPGLLDTLQWHERKDTAKDLGEDEVEISTRAVGINFRDVLSALGMLSSVGHRISLGIEMSGVIGRIGPAVKHVSPGDRVFAVARGGLLATSAVVPSATVLKIPDDLSFEDAATMPTCFATVIRSIVEVGNMEEGQTILVHSACGGVGHAALQICKTLGVQVFATVGSDSKAQYLVDTFGIPRNHVFSSRNDAFVRDLIQRTNGRGVDLVLNSLGGELLHASWECVAECGIMIELGRRDLEEHSRLDMQPFLANRSYCCVEVAHLMGTKPRKARQLLAKCLEMYESGEITPVHPITIFQASEVQQAFRHLQKGTHIGKAVLRFPDNEPITDHILRPLRFEGDASYLLVGGFGGLGRAVARWMVEKGARNLIIMSKNAGLGTDHQGFIAELEALGCLVKPFKGQVERRDDVERAIATAELPIKGVIHMAMVLRDVPFLDMKHEEWQEVMEPKVGGAWNLHHAFERSALDFFVLASSITSVLGTPGQSNYSSANSFLDSFCQYRRTLGLPASTISICPIEDAGFVAENSAARKSIQAQGIEFLSQREFLDCLELGILNSFPSSAAACRTSSDRPDSQLDSGHFVMGLKSERHLDDPENHTPWRGDRRMGFYHNVKKDKNAEITTSTNPLSSFLARASSDPGMLADVSNVNLLAVEIGRKIFSIILRPEEDVNISLSIASIGVDSLLAIEVRRWWKMSFGVDISVLEIMGAGTLEGLGKLAAQMLRDKLGG